MIEWLDNFGGEIIETELSMSVNVDELKYETDTVLCGEKRNANIDEIGKSECDRLHALAERY